MGGYNEFEVENIEAVEVPPKRPKKKKVAVPAKLAVRKVGK
jgi:hypothetical protein